MIDQEFNESVDKQIALLQLSNILSVASVDEKLGKWDELLESRETSIKLFQNLFSIAPDELTTENQEKISNLRLTEYPRELCSLSKCYIVKERYDDAIQAYQQCIDIKADDAEAWAAIGSIYLHQAHVTYEQFNLPKSDPSYNKQKNAITQLYRQACTAFEQSRKFDENNKTLWLEGLRETYFKLNRGKSLRTLEKL